MVIYFKVNTVTHKISDSFETIAHCQNCKTEYKVDAQIESTVSIIKYDKNKIVISNIGE